MKRFLRATAGCAGLAVLSACASHSGNVAAGESTDYYLAHAAGNYNPPGPPSDPWGPYVRIAARRFDVPEPWIRQVMRAESGGHEYMGGQLTVSSAGAMGLMQLEPETYQEMAARYGLGSDPFNPYDNIMAGTAYIHEMYAVYGSPGFLAAYDAGPGRLDSFMTKHRALPQETVAYVAEIAPSISGYYPSHRSDADQLALNTERVGHSNGIVPYGFDPDAPAPNAPAPYVPEEVADVRQVSEPEPVYHPQLAMPVAHHSFSLIPAAMADTLPASDRFRDDVPAAHGNWAIQVGAYDSSAHARAALGMAELSAVQMLIHGHPVVVSVHVAGRLKYRARVVGLGHEDALNACHLLETGPTRCAILSPEAQS
jgi:hypothetical protein